ncbi:DoxX family protein [Fulvivirgaceae bacterium BMA10]|uniref:DoxX family protein n=1 Tax=Splendidivirga corallicola TaxID=3051826 RepID=A0ABT8KRX7_9BACT|nr:DoxX family protein [Fulvivirgaceae bacterium BMA10]
MKIVILLARYFVGLLFIFSGMIKVNDPVGTAIKMEEYFEVFAGDFASFFHFFVPYALEIAVFLSVLEVVLGIALLLSIRMNVTSWILLLLILFFTFLTFYSAYFNKVTDCGCFGDAIKLTPWQSFYKDIILLVLIIVLFIYRKNIKPILKVSTGDIVTGTSFVIGIIIAIYAIRHLPFVDFRAYKVGANIPAAMQPSEDLRYKYIMTKDGEEHEFEKYPTDGGYEFKEMILLNPEAQPKITDYSVWNDEGDFTDQTLEGNKLLVVTYDVKKSDSESFQEINNLLTDIDNSNITSWVLTATDGATFETFRHEVQLAAPYFFADATVLKTILRANPGLILLKDGVVKGKWHNNDIPSSQEIMTLIGS